LAIENDDAFEPQRILQSEYSTHFFITRIGVSVKFLYAPFNLINGTYRGMPVLGKINVFVCEKIAL